MPDLFISGISRPLLNKFRNRINTMRDGGAKKGDTSKYAIEAIKSWLDNTTPKDRGYLLLQKENDDLKAENLRLNSAENPDYQVLRTENLELAKENYELKLNTQGKATVTIDIGYAQEVFEILCGITFDDAVIQDSEPSNERHPAIESMIQQLKDRIEKEEQ